MVLWHFSQLGFSQIPRCIQIIPGRGAWATIRSIPGPGPEPQKISWVVGTPTT